MVWAVDLDSDSNPAVDALNSGSYGSSSTSNVSQKQINAQMKYATTSYNGATLGLFWTPCLPPGSQTYPQGYQALTRGHGKVFDVDLNHISGEGCHGEYQDHLMGLKTLTARRWRKWLQSCVVCSQCFDVLQLRLGGGGGNAGLCNSKCPNNYIQISKNTHVGGDRTSCDVLRYRPYCCQSITGYSPGFCYAKALDHVLAGSLAARQDLSGVTEYVYSNLGTSNKKRDESNETDYHPDIAERNADLVANMLSKRGDVIYCATCIGSGALPLGAIPVDIPFIRKSCCYWRLLGILYLYVECADSVAYFKLKGQEDCQIHNYERHYHLLHHESDLRRLKVPTSLLELPLRR